MSKTQAIRNISARAMRHFDELTVAEKVALLKSLAVANTGAESELASAMAFNLERLDETQLKFRELLNGVEAAP